MKKTLLLLLLSTIIFSCSPQKRLNRLAEKHPELFKTDTIWRLDTFRVEGGRVDTIIKSGITKDTIFIYQGNQTIKYFNDGKTVYLQGETKTVEVIRKVPVLIKAPVVKVTENKAPWWMCVLLVILLIALMLSVIRRF